MNKLVMLLVFSCASIFAQEQTKPPITYMKFDVSASLRGNPNRGETDANNNQNDSWFIPDGLSSHFGYGIHHKKWLLLGVDSGIDWKGSEALVAIPVFGNLRLSPKVSESSRIYVQAGFGKSFAIGRGNLSGDYRRISIGFESDDFSFFVDWSQHGFPLHDVGKVNSISLGLSLLTF